MLALAMGLALALTLALVLALAVPSIDGISSVAGCLLLVVHILLLVPFCC